MPYDGQSTGEKFPTATLNPQSEGEHGPTIAAVRLAQEASDLTRRPVSNGLRGVRDVTDDFVQASERLPPGDLVKDEYFTLFEAVGALEIMDPKMDSGCVPPGDTFEPDFDAVDGLEPGQVLWIMEELLRLEMNFHDGYPLSQNIFTSLHIFNLISPDNKYPYHFLTRKNSRKNIGVDQHYDLVHIVLRAHCIAVLKCCHLTLRFIQSQTFYEEEDFVTFLFGRELLPRLECEEALLLLTEAIEWLCDANIDLALKQALISHIKMRENALLAMDNQDQRWEHLKSNIEMLERYRDLSKPLLVSFSNKVQRQLATSTPPRPMPDLSWEDACKKWKQLCDDVLAASSLTSVEVRHSPHSLQNATWTFAYREPPPSTFARAKMQDMLTGNDTFGDDTPHFDHLLADIRELVLAGDGLADMASFQVEVTTDPRHACSRLIEDFMSRALGEYLSLFRMICQNRCRMRRTFTQAVPVFDEIESDARITDQRLNEIVTPRSTKDESGRMHYLEPLTLWSRTYKLHVMEWVVQLGFETDIYLQDEIGSMYMLLIDIADRRREELCTIERFTSARLDMLSKAGDSNQYRECQSSKIWLHSLILMVNVDIAIASALTYLYVCLEATNVIDVSARRYSRSQLRYEARVKPLLNISNDTIPAIDQLEQRKAKLKSTVSEMCAHVARFITAAKTSLTDLKGMKVEQIKRVGTGDQWRAELKRLETVCVAVSVTASQLSRVAKRYGKADSGHDNCLEQSIDVVVPPPGKRYHDWWVVPQLKDRNLAQGKRPA